MRRFIWGLLLVLIIGFGIGLAYAWVIAPRNIGNSAPATLRTDFKDQFRAAIAASYAATGNLPRAQARLELLGDDNLVESMNTQAQREIANGQFETADQLAILASALETGAGIPIQTTPTIEFIEPVTFEPSLTPFPSPEDIPFVVTETPEVIETLPTLEVALTQTSSLEAQFITPQPNPATATPRPTRTAPPTQGAPFRLTATDSVCDPNLPENLLQVMVYNSNRRQLAGVKIIVTWDSGEDAFFTGFKPELGNGYADFVMEAGTTYTVQLGLGSEVALNITPHICQTSDGESYNGGYKLTFQQP